MAENASGPPLIQFPAEVSNDLLLPELLALRNEINKNIQALTGEQPEETSSSNVPCFCNSARNTSDVALNVLRKWKMIEARIQDRTKGQIKETTKKNEDTNDNNTSDVIVIQEDDESSKEPIKAEVTAPEGEQLEERPSSDMPRVSYVAESIPEEIPLEDVNGLKSTYPVIAAVNAAENMETTTENYNTNENIHNEFNVTVIKEDLGVMDTSSGDIPHEETNDSETNDSFNEEQLIMRQRSKYAASFMPCTLNLTPDIDDEDEDEDDDEDNIHYNEDFAMNLKSDEMECINYYDNLIKIEEQDINADLDRQLKRKKNVRNNKRSSATPGPSAKKLNNLETPGTSKPREIKICLKRMSPILNNSIRFCQKCLILFPDRNSAAHHNKVTHGTANKGSKKSKSQIQKTKKKDTRKISFDEDNLPLMATNIDKKIKRHNCLHCDKVFDSEGLLNSHMDEVLSRNEQQKSRIGSKKLKKVLTRNSKEEAGNENAIYYRCQTCNYYFKLINAYTKHLDNKHNMSDILNQKVLFNSYCKSCKRHYKTALSFNSHIRRRHEKQLNFVKSQ